MGIFRLTIAALILAAPIGAVAQDFPTRAIRIISGTQTGTSGDIVGRMLAPRLTAALGQPVIFESRPGANGALAANYVKGLPADGYNLFFVSSSTIVSGPFLVKNLEFDVFRDFSPITVAVRVPSFLLVHSSLPFNSVNGLVDYARANPGKLAYGSVGRGSAFHLIGESFKLATGVDMLHVPYSGANNANIVVDLLNNRIQVYFPAYPKRDYTTVEAPFPTMKAMLTEKKVDLIPAVLPFALDPELRKISRTLFTSRDAVGVTQFVSWNARRSFISKNRAAMVDFMEDTLRITRWYVDPANKKEVAEIASRITKQPPERFSWLFTAQDYYRNPDMLPNLDAWQSNVRVTNQRCAGC